MPIYEYWCEDCGHELEVIQKMSDAPLTGCPACGKPALKKKISASGFRLKGSGWYETDFKTSGKKNLVKDDAASAKSEVSGKEAKDSSPDSKKEAAASTKASVG